MSNVFTDHISIENVPLPVDGSGVTQPISGSVSVSNFPSTQPVSAASLPLPSNAAQETGGHLASIDTKLTAPLQTITANATTATLTIVSQSNATDTLLLASNPNRKSAIIFLPKSGTSVAYDTTASATHFTFHTGASNTTITVTGYTGPIHSFGSADTINVTELV